MLKRIGIAFGASLLLTAFTALGRFAWGGPFPPEQMAQVLFAHIPVWAFTPLFRLFGLSSKYWAFAGMVGLHLAVWSCAGGWLLAQGGRTMFVGLVVLLAFTLILLPLGGDGWFGAALPSGPLGTVLTLVGAVALYGGVLALARRGERGGPAAPNRREFLRTAAVAAAERSDLLLVDTMGRSPQHREGIQAIRSVLAAVPDAEVHLVLSATTKRTDLEEILRRYRPLGYDCVVISKLDEAQTLGPILAAVLDHALPVSYLTTGQEVPDDLEGAVPRRLARWLLNPYVPEGLHACA